MEYFQPLLSSTKLDIDGHEERLRQNAIKGLLQEEADFVQSSQHGIQLFSRPLRVLISAEERTALFQILEKIVAMTDSAWKSSIPPLPPPRRPPIPAKMASSTPPARRTAPCLSFS